jgi:hypothetical protein
LIVVRFSELLAVTIRQSRNWKKKKKNFSAAQLQPAWQASGPERDVWITFIFGLLKAGEKNHFAFSLSQLGGGEGQEISKSARKKKNFSACLPNLLSVLSACPQHVLYEFPRRCKPQPHFGGNLH